MVTLSRRLSPNPRLRAEGQLPVSFTEGVAAAAGLAHQQALGQLVMGAGERAEADVAPAQRPGQPLAYNPETGRVERYDVQTGRFILPDRISADELNERYGHLGLEFERPMTAEAAAALADGKRAEIIRQDILRRAPGGLANVGYFGAGLLGTAADPLELATALIPGIGAARTAWLVSRLGRVGGRAAAGAIGGAVGNALVEPAIWGLSRQAQLDYTMADALMSVAFGGILGGAGGALAGVRRRGSSLDPVEREAPDVSEGIDLPRINAGRRRIPDILAVIPPRTRLAALRTSVAQIAQGRTVNVDGLGRIVTGERRPPPPDLFRADADIPPSVRDEGAAEARPVRRADGPAEAQESPVGRRPDETQEITAKAEEAATAPSQPRTEAAGGEPAAEATPRTESAEEISPGMLAMQREPASWVIRNRESGEAVMETFDPKVVEALNTAKYEAVPAIEHLVGLNSTEAARRLRLAAIEAEAGPGRDFSGDDEASRAFDEEPPFDVEADTDALAAMVGQIAREAEAADADELMAIVARMRDSGALAGSDLEELAALDAMERKAAAVSDVARAAAVCLAR